MTANQKKKARKKDETKAGKNERAAEVAPIDSLKSVLWLACY